MQGPLSRYTGEGEAAGKEAPEADLEALAAAHVNGVAGACLAIGIRYAGSGNAAAQALLQACALDMLAAREAAPDASASAYGTFLPGINLAKRVLGLQGLNSLSGSAFSLDMIAP